MALILRHISIIAAQHRLINKNDFCSFSTDKKDLSPSEEWGVDEKLISKLKEQYRKERKGKKGIQSMNGYCLFYFVFYYCDLLLNRR